MQIVFGAAAIVVALALIIFPGVREKLKVLAGGFLNIFVEDMAKTPEGAKAVFQQAIEEVQQRYNKAGERHGVKFCVSDIRQSQGWRCENRAESGLEPLSTTGPDGRGGMRAACGVNAAPVVWTS